MWSKKEGKKQIFWPQSDNNGKRMCFIWGNFCCLKNWVLPSPPRLWSPSGFQEISKVRRTAEEDSQEKFLSGVDIYIYICLFINVYHVYMYIINGLKWNTLKCLELSLMVNFFSSISVNIWQALRIPSQIQKLDPDPGYLHISGV